MGRLLQISKRLLSFKILNRMKMDLPETRGVVLSGTELAKEIRNALTEDVKAMRSKLPKFAPGLSIVQVGGREDSNVYIRMKIKAASEIGIHANHVKLPNTTTETELINHVNKLNDDPNVHGIIVQMPLDSVNKIDSHVITDTVSPAKDVDGLNTINEGRVAIGDMSGFLPCTPNGCIELIKKSGVPISGATAVVLGRSKIVGTPVAELLKWQNATVTVCHSRTKDLPKVVSQADILVVGIGQPEMVKGSWIKPGAVVIDCGINSIPDSTKKSGQRLVGDVAYEEASKVASYITPVPGGVGPMTVAMLMKNTVISALRSAEKLLSSAWSFKALPLKRVEPIPNDITISRSQEPKNIGVLAEEIGLSPSEYSLYGNKKAKISLRVLDRLKSQKNGKYVVKGKSRETSFCISVGSEIMAILALSTGVEDMKNRLANIVVGFSKSGEPLTADDFGATGAMAVLLKDAIEPTLMQSIEGTPVLVHAGPFANIAHGCSSIIADAIGLKLVGSDGFVVTEAGFGSDIGMEKFFDIKCRTSGHVPNAVVLVTTVRALKMHGGGPAVTPGAPLKPQYVTENIDLIKKGLPNLIKHISNGTKFGIPVVVAINSHATDTESELNLIKEAALIAGAFDAVICTHWAKGGEGALELADAVIAATKKPTRDFKLLYNLNTGIEEKINIIAKEMYGAGQVVLVDKVKQKIEEYTKLGYDKLPLCMAKTSNSLTGDAAIKGAPTGFTLEITDIFVSVGAGFVVPMVGEIMRMPGLPTRPSIYDMDWNGETDEIEGLF
ncbi:C-1-tetrahydrofolate synthase, cytoplasmic isoform X3 [Neodiprion virginianus]|uniref:C-1-tetrahydrofolate synthase, cytoplasmic isoform X3 n=1 Tax=Neodiprion virginianus TaxID=2961670 RepID=UPI001EE72F11|nr:C-1-tetrahydrofolate synthase, cytoplasmic isoform X3 [Neodiprion virginianus]